jgi:hypothetical protein
MIASIAGKFPGMEATHMLTRSDIRHTVSGHDINPTQSLSLSILGKTMRMHCSQSPMFLRLRVPYRFLRTCQNSLMQPRCWPVTSVSSAGGATGN